MQILLHRIFRLDVYLEACKTCGKLSILTLVADRKGQLIVGNDDRAHLLLLLGDVNSDNISGSKSLCNKYSRIFVIDDNVYLFSAQLLNDLADSGTSWTYAGTNAVNIGIL